jgi:hypothetical protein
VRWFFGLINQTYIGFFILNACSEYFIKVGEYAKSILSSSENEPQVYKEYKENTKILVLFYCMCTKTSPNTPKVHILACTENSLKEYNI